MRHSKLLIGAAALALLAGTGIALPQAVAQERSGPAMNQAPGGQEKGKASNQEKGKAGNAQREGQGAQPGRAQSEGGKQKSDQTTGQAPPANQAQPQRSQRGGDEQPAPKAEQPAPKAQQNQLPKQGAGQRERNETTGQQSPRQQDQAPAARGQGQPQGQPQQPQAQQPQAQPQQGQSAPRSGAETQGQAGARVQFTTEQRTRIRETIIQGSNAPRATNVTFAISVGTVVPRTVRLAPLPTLIVDVEPTWRGYMYFLVGDEIIVVEPNTLRIVAVIAV